MRLILHFLLAWQYELAGPSSQKMEQITKFDL